MFGKHLYHRMVRKYVAYFGTLFNNVEVRRYDKDGSIIGRIRVPISFASKDYYRQRLVADPELARQASQMLPRMGFMMSGMAYDVSRKMNPLHNYVSRDSAGKVITMAHNIPYDLSFELHVWCKMSEDGQQILEQILPNFHPDFTASLKLVRDMNLSMDVPLILDSVSSDDTYENSPDGTRVIIWTLTFTMKAYFFPGVTDPGGTLIKHVDLHLGTGGRGQGFQSNLEIKPSPATATPFEPYTIDVDQNFFDAPMHFNPITCEPQLDPYEG